jgi:PilZ domain
MSDWASSANPEKRKYERISLSLKGHLFDPGNETEIGCELINLSGGGAALKSECELPLGKHMVLYIEGFGREVIVLGRCLGRVVRHHRHGIAIQYVRALPPAI